MRRYLLVLMVLCAFPSLSRCYQTAESPREIAGFALNANIAQYSGQLNTETVLPLRHMEYLSEGQTKDINGYKSGYIDFGNCETPGRIVAIKMKYARSDKDFYEKLLKLFKNKYGDPTEWRGDAFHTFIAWKWSFKDKNGDAISMILQHGASEDNQLSQGNSVKLTNWTAIEKESKCYDASHPQPEPTPAETVREDKTPLQFPKDYEQFVPK